MPLIISPSTVGCNDRTGYGGGFIRNEIQHGRGLFPGERPAVLGIAILQQAHRLYLAHAESYTGLLLRRHELFGTFYHGSPCFRHIDGVDTDAVRCIVDGGITHQPVYCMFAGNVSRIAGQPRHSGNRANHDNSASIVLFYHPVEHGTH